MKKLTMDELVKEAAKTMLAPDELYDDVQTSFIKLEEKAAIAFDQAFTYGYIFVLRRLRIDPVKDAYGELTGLSLSLDREDDVYAHIEIAKLGEDTTLPWRFGLDDKEIGLEDIEDEQNLGENHGNGES